MKSIFLALLLLGSLSGYSQSNSYLTLKDTFKHGEDVVAVSVNGFLCRTILRMAGEHEFREAITDIDNIRVMVVPMVEFKKKALSVHGFKKILKEDAFQELANFRDSGDAVSVFLQQSKKQDRYFFLIDEGDEVIGLEMSGTLDMNVIYKLMKEEAGSEVSGK